MSRSRSHLNAKVKNLHTSNFMQPVLLSKRVVSIGLKCVLDLNNNANNNVYLPHLTVSVIHKGNSNKIIVDDFGAGDIFNFQYVNWLQNCQNKTSVTILFSSPTSNLSAR